jgi:acetyltransferase-like isoleucine patch superfamily enzyme
MEVMEINDILRKAGNRSLAQFFAALPRFIRGGYISLRLGQSILPVSARGKIRIVKKNAVISIGAFTDLWPGVKLSCHGATPHRKAHLTIGERCSIGDRTEIHVGEQVTIGNEVIIAWDCVIMDRDYHSVAGAAEATKGVTISDHVWIGCRAIILKGVQIGEGAIVGAGSVVTSDVEPYTLVAGNPARVIKPVSGWQKKP